MARSIRVVDMTTRAGLSPAVSGHVPARDARDAIRVWPTFRVGPTRSRLWSRAGREQPARVLPGWVLTRFVIQPSADPAGSLPVPLRVG